MSTRSCFVFGVLILSLIVTSNLFAGGDYTEFCDAVKKNMNEIYPIKSVIIENRSMKIVTNLNKIDSKAYYTMVPSVCMDLKDYPNIANDLKEIVVLNKWGRQGWVFENPSKYDEILKTPVKKLKLEISFHTHMHMN